jgi:ABC-type phosphate transport system substrate-binding protein
MKFATPFAAALVIGLALPSLARAENPKDILIVANAAAGVTELSLADVRDMFLKKRTSWPGGTKVVPVNVTDGSGLRNDFRAKVLSMTSAQEQSYWQERKIKAGESTPSVFGDTLRAVFKLRGAIGYVYRSQFKEGTAKVLLVIPAG